jgi:hypothetical protein
VKPGRSETPLAVRFWKHVARRSPGECWDWSGALFRNGYGKIHKIELGRTRTLLTHRVAWTLEHGLIPDGMHVLHRCDRPSCVNPGHLFLGTQADNVADMIQKGRGNWPGPSSERAHKAKLTPESVRKIRCDWEQLGVTQAELAQRWNVSPSAISHIVLRKTWGNV